MARRVLMAVLGLALVGFAFPATGYLTNYAWSVGAPGFWLVVALPGLALLAISARRRPLLLAPLLPFAFVLIGLDVTDSARPEVVAGGYGVAGLSAAATVASVLVVRRAGRTPARSRPA